MYKSILLKEINKNSLEKIKLYNLDAIVVHSTQINKEKISMIKDVLGKDIKIEVIFNCFEGKSLQDKFSEARPLEVEEKDVNEHDYHPVSPTNSEVRDFLLEQIKELAGLEINTVWLNQLHFATKWWVSEPKVLDTDYSDAVLKKFEDYIGESIEGSNLEEKYLHIDGSYYHEWLLFKTGFINEFVKSAKKILNPQKIEVGVFLVAWEETDYRAGIKRILGQDHGDLVDIADKIALYMPYHAMEKDIEWVKAKLQYFWHLGKTFVSVVDVSNKSNHSSLDQVLPLLQQTPSAGYLIDNFEKLDTSGQEELLK